MHLPNVQDNFLMTVVFFYHRKIFGNEWIPNTIVLSSDGYIFRQDLKGKEYKIDLKIMGRFAKTSNDAYNDYGAPKLPKWADKNRVMCIPNNKSLVKKDMWWLIFLNYSDFWHWSSVINTYNPSTIKQHNEFIGSINNYSNSNASFYNGTQNNVNEYGGYNDNQYDSFDNWRNNHFENRNHQNDAYGYNPYKDRNHEYYS